MADTDARRPGPTGIGASRVLAVLTASLMLGGCAQLGVETPQLLAAAKPTPAAASAPGPQDLQKATEYWGQAFATNPRDLDAALNYAKNLKASGHRSRALAVLQQASVFHGSDRRLNSEYGRLALDLDQISVASRLLEAADDPANPDWRVISARGTALAKQTLYREAIPYYERALVLSQDHPSVLNNLALAHTMSGEVAKGEDYLRRAIATGGPAQPRVRQNLALVLGLQGKYDESTTVASATLPPDSAAANAQFLKKMVQLEPKTADVEPDWSAKVAKAEPGAKPAAKPAAAPAEAAPSEAAPSEAAAAALKPASTETETSMLSTWAAQVAAAPSADAAMDIRAAADR